MLPYPVHAQLRAVVLTALTADFKAVRDHLTDIDEVVHPQGSIYTCGTFPVQEGDWQIAIAQAGPGNIRAALEAERVIQHFRPHVVMFVGVAGSLKFKDVRRGDVVAATKVYGYESGKDGATFQARPEAGNATHAMEQRARAEAGKDTWRQRIHHPLSTLCPAVLIGPIAAGEKVLRSRTSELVGFLKATYEDALAVEMEGYGFLKAAHVHQNVNALVVRGISGPIEGNNATDEDDWQEIAARHASAFAFEVLARNTRYELARLSQADHANTQRQQDKFASQSGPYTVNFHAPAKNVAIGDHSKIINDH
jgi:nucleoside phosphorylase